MPDLVLSDKQRQSVHEADGTVNLWHGSVRSGKTIASLLRWLLDVAMIHVRGELVVVSRTRDSAARNVFSPLADPTLFGATAHHVKYTPGAPSATVLGRKVWVLGSSDVRSENTLRGLTCAGAYVDEATLLQEDFFTQLLNRRWQGARVFATTNPDNPGHWLKRQHLDNLHQRPDWRTWHFTLNDNPQLSEDRKAAIRRENTGLYYRRNVLGEWVAAEGAVFDMWDPAKHVIPWNTLPRMRRLIGLGIDYGTQNPSAALLLGQGEDGRLYFVDEWRYDPKLVQVRMTDAQQSAALRAWLREPHLPYVNNLEPRWIVIDPAAASFQEQLFRDGLTAVHADNHVVLGIRAMASLLAQGNLLVSDRCRGFIAEAPTYAWDAKKSEKGEDAPIKTADHSLDAGRYVLLSTEVEWRPQLREAA